MKKFVRLTENDLIRIVKRVINEQPTDENKPLCSQDNFKKVRALIKSGYNFTISVDPNNRKYIIVADESGMNCGCTREELFILQ